MSGLSGSIRRVYSDALGQHLILSVTGTPESITTLENDLLHALNAQWTWETRLSKEVDFMSNFQFNIIQSGCGAIRGENSDSKYDNKSEKSINSKSSGSSKK